MTGSLHRKINWALAGLLVLGAGCAHQDHAGVAAAPKNAAARAPRAELGASVAFDARGVLWAVSKESGHVMIRRSADLGATWSAPQRVNAQPEPIAAGGDSFPKIAAGGASDLYVAWSRPLGSGHVGDIRFARSTDGGASFSAPITIHTDRQEIPHCFESIAVNGAGQVFIAWIDKRDQVARKAENAAYRGAALYYTVSDDRGASFRGDFKVVDHICECCRIALATQPDGSVVAMWRHIFEPNVRDHAIARLNADGRASGFRRATWDDWKVNACPHHGGSVATDSLGRLHAVWFSQAEGHAGVFYGRLGEKGVEGEKRVGGDRAEHADLAVSGSRIAIVWKEFDGERSQLQAMVSADGGTTWTGKALASTSDASDHPRVIAREGRFLAFWNTAREPLSVIALP